MKQFFQNLTHSEVSIVWKVTTIASNIQKINHTMIEVTNIQLVCMNRINYILPRCNSWAECYTFSTISNWWRPIAAYLALEILCNLLEGVEVWLKGARCLSDKQQHMILHVAAKDFRGSFLSEFRHQRQPVAHNKLLHCLDADALRHVRTAFVELPQNTRQPINRDELYCLYLLDMHKFT